MQCLIQWIATRQSGSVIGLPGCGRSNLLDFLCTRPERLQTQQSITIDPVIVVPVNLQTLPATDIATFYRVLLRAFYYATPRFAPALQDVATHLYRENIKTQDPFLSQSALQELLSLFQESGVCVVLVLNHFDYFLQEATLKTVNTLRGLRDDFRHNLCIIAGMQQEVAYLPNPGLLGEMYELLDRNVCWVGAMADQDARDLVARATYVAPIPLKAAEIDAILQLAGNFPSLLQLVSQWWSYTLPPQPVGQWLSMLIEENNIRYRLAKMWQGLTQEEQFLLSEIQGMPSYAFEETTNVQNASILRREILQHHELLLTRLVKKGVCEQHKERWNIRGDLFRAYVKEIGGSARGRIWLDKETQEIYQGLVRIDGLPPLERKLLQHFLAQPYKPHGKEVLIAHIWGDKCGDMVDNDLQQLVYRLRKKIDGTPPQYIVTWKGHPSGYQFYPEGRPG